MKAGCAGGSNCAAMLGGGFVLCGGEGNKAADATYVSIERLCSTLRQSRKGSRRVPPVDGTSLALSSMKGSSRAAED